MNTSNKNGTMALTVVASVLLALVSCEKDMSLDKWKPDILAPLAKGTIKVEDVAQIRNKKWTQTVPPADIGYVSGLPVDVPALDIDYVGPYQYTISDIIDFIQVDTMDFRITFTNNYPIIIQAGTQIVFRNSASTSSEANVLFRHFVSHDVLPTQTYSVDTLLTNKLLNADLYLYIEHFKSNGGNGVTFSSQPMEITYEIRLLNTYTVGVKTNKELSVIDTADIEPWDDQETYNDSTATGKLSIYLSNSLPINLHYKMYFYDDNFGQPLDSIYTGDMYAAGGQTDANGEQVGTVVENRFDDTLTIDRIRRIRTASHIVYSLVGDTYGYSGSTVVAGRNCKLSLQVVGDLKINISKLF